MKNNILKFLMICFGLLLINGCVSEYYNEPLSDCTDPGLISNKTIAQIYAVAINPTGTIANSPTYSANDIIEGYVVSSDEGGNFYQSIYVQALDKSKGFNISVDIKSAYLRKLQPGKRVYLKMKGLGFANPTGSFARGLIFGAPPTDIFAVDRLENYENFIVPTCDVVKEDFLVNKITIAQAIANDNYLNTLVEFDNVQFDDVTAGGTYDFNLSNTFDDNTFITDASTPTKLIVRTSRFANFSGFKTPFKNGKIRGVLTKYSSSYQIVLRTERDVRMENPRVLPPSNPLGGTNLVYSNSINEQFTSFTVGQNSFANYINDEIIGNRYWAVKQFPANTGNKFIEMSAFSGTGNPGAPSTSYFMVPVDFTSANSLSFKKAARFNKGACLNVYYLKSSDFVAGSLNPFLFTNITSSFNITYPAIDASQNSFDSAGIYNIDTSLTGTGFFIFEYVGSTIVTTTMQLDDIVIN